MAHSFNLFLLDERGVDGALLVLCKGDSVRVVRRMSSALYARFGSLLSREGGVIEASGGPDDDPSNLVKALLPF